MTILAVPDSITRQQVQDFSFVTPESGISMATTNTGAYQYGNPYSNRPSHHIPPYLKVVGAVVFSLAAMALLAKLLHFCWLRSMKDDAQQEADTGGDRRGRRPTGVDGDDGGVVAPRRQQPPAPAAVAVEMVRAMGPLVCTYLRADGWPAEATCAVCLAVLADGDALRVLPVCMHYFHAACVGEWLRAHDTCPLCRAPLAPPAAADGAAA